MSHAGSPPSGLGGYFYAWWRGDPLPTLALLPGFTATPTVDAALLARLAQLRVSEVRRRLDGGNVAYLACLNGTPTAYGWSAARQGDIVEAALHFPLPPGERYLWDFATLPEWRGRGLYPRLLQAIVRLEGEGVQRLWIGHDARNDASRKGIERAGFQVVGAVYGEPGRMWIDALGASERAQAAARLLGLPLGPSTAA